MQTTSPSPAPGTNAPPRVGTGRGGAAVTVGLGLALACRVSAQRLEPVAPPASSAQLGAVSGGPIGAVVTRAVVERLRARTLTPEAAWGSGALGVDEVLFILEKHVDPWGGFFWAKDAELRRGLVKLLLERGGERTRDVSRLSPTVRLWIADYYGSLGDARVVPLARGIVDEQKFPLKGESPLVYQAIERLGWYHGAKGEFLQARDAWLSIDTLAVIAPEEAAFAVLQGARMAAAAGRAEEAEALFERSMGKGNALVDAASLNDRAQKKMDAEQWVQARAILQRPIRGGHLGRGQILLWSKLGYAFYCEGDMAQARAWSQKCVQVFDSLSPEEREYESLPQYAAEARAAIQWVDTWAKTPLVVLPGTIRLPLKQADLPKPALSSAQKQAGELAAAGLSDNELLAMGIQPAAAPRASATTRGAAQAAAPAAPKTLSFRVSVRSAGVQSVEVVPGVPFVRAQLVLDGWTKRRKYFQEQEVRVEVDPQGLALALAKEGQVARAPVAAVAPAAAGAAAAGSPSSSPALADEDKVVATLLLRTKGVGGGEVRLPIKLAKSSAPPAAVKAAAAAPKVAPAAGGEKK